MGTCLCRPFVQHPECVTHPSRLRKPGGPGLPAPIVDRDPGDETDYVEDEA